MEISYAKFNAYYPNNSQEDYFIFRLGYDTRHSKQIADLMKLADQLDEISKLNFSFPVSEKCTLSGHNKCWFYFEQQIPGRVNCTDSINDAAISLWNRKNDLYPLEIEYNFPGLYSEIDLDFIYNFIHENSQILYICFLSRDGVDEFVPIHGSDSFEHRNKIKNRIRRLKPTEILVTYRDVFSFIGG